MVNGIARLQHAINFLKEAILIC